MMCKSKKWRWKWSGTIISISLHLQCSWAAISSKVLQEPKQIILFSNALQAKTLITLNYRFVLFHLKRNLTCCKAWWRPWKFLGLMGPTIASHTFYVLDHHYRANTVFVGEFKFVYKKWPTQTWNFKMDIKKPLEMGEHRAVSDRKLSLEIDTISVAILLWRVKLCKFAYEAYVSRQGNFTIWDIPWPQDHLHCSRMNTTYLM